MDPWRSPPSGASPPWTPPSAIVDWRTRGYAALSPMGDALFMTDSASDSGGDTDATSISTAASIGALTVPTRSRKRSKKNSDDDEEMKSPIREVLGQQQKPRLPSYLQQKHEKDELMEQMRILEAHLELLKLKAGLPTIQDKKSVANTKANNFAVEEEIHKNLLQLGRFQALLSRQVQDTPVNPMTTFIHLPREPQQRRAVLESIKDVKLRRAQELATERMHAFDHRKPFRSEEYYMSDDGKYHLKFFQMQQYEGLRDARQLYDALLFFYSNIEISVTEMIGQLTLREDVEEPTNNSVWSHRIVTEGDAGTTEELNLVGFSRFYEHYIPHNGAQFGVVALDTVDEDDLYPYKPLERTRKDVHMAYTMTEYHEPGCNQSPLVVLRTCIHIAQHPAAFPLPPGVWDKLIENMTRWIDVMNKAIRDYTTSK